LRDATSLSPLAPLGSQRHARAAHSTTSPTQGRTAGKWYRSRPNSAHTPLGRQGHVDEIAATCLFLVSDDGGFITGQTIHVNGGAHYY